MSYARHAACKCKAGATVIQIISSPHPLVFSAVALPYKAYAMRYLQPRQDSACCFLCLRRGQCLQVNTCGPVHIMVGNGGQSIVPGFIDTTPPAYCSNTDMVSMCFIMLPYADKHMWLGHMYVVKALCAFMLYVINCFDSPATSVRAFDPYHDNRYSGSSHPLDSFRVLLSRWPQIQIPTCPTLNCASHCKMAPTVQAASRNGALIGTSVMELAC